MQAVPEFLLSLGGILLLGLATDALGRHTWLPRVTLLLVFGALIGDEALGLVPAILSDNFELIANMALLLIGFLLGGKLTQPFLRQSATRAVLISLSVALITSAAVTIVLYLAGVPLAVALLLGCIGAATAPAATIDVVIEYNTKGPFADLLVSVVALDDIWGLMLFSFAVAFVVSLSGNAGETSHVLLAVREIVGAMLLGLALGFPAAYLTGRIRPGQPMLTEALGLVFLCGGLALWLDVSFLIAAVTLGAVIANFARHHEYAFHEIENVEWPVVSLFFVLAGASLEFSALMNVGFIGVVYIMARIAGKIMGTWLGARATGADAITRRYLGIALIPQAGIAIGMVLMAANAIPEYGQVLLPVVIGSTVFFEVVGPVLTRFALQQAQRAGG